MLPLFYLISIESAKLPIQEPTIEPIFANSLSAVTATDWTRNLSRHLASKGGSCFIACKRTAMAHQIRAMSQVEVRQTCDFYLLSRLNSSRVWPNTIPNIMLAPYISRVSLTVWPTYCFGAVVLTCDDLLVTVICDYLIALMGLP
jgi:hypothetical protein